MPDGAPRPLWSVMIPTYNCAAYLRETLASVLAQDPGPEHMQIEVVDDCSTKDDPSAIVRELSPDGRVAFHRHPANVGAIANFNACIRRSRGHLVHILHGDDAVLPGFYSAVENLARRHPGKALLATRTFCMDETGLVFALSPDFPSDGEFAASSDHVSLNPFLTPSVVMRRTFYEAHGGFDPAHPHVADHEMWLRATKRAGGAVTRQVLARYREHRGNDTSRLARTAANLSDAESLGIKLCAHDEAFSRRRLRRELGLRALAQAGRFAHGNHADPAAAEANRRFYWRMMGRVAGFLHLLGLRIGRRYNRWVDRLVPDRTPAADIPTVRSRPCSFRKDPCA